MSGKSDFKHYGELVIHLKFSYSNMLIMEKYEIFRTIFPPHITNKLCHRHTDRQTTVSCKTEHASVAMDHSTSDIT